MIRSIRMLAIALSLFVTSASYAQTVLIPGALRGPGTIGPTGAKRLCAPLSVGLYEWRIGWMTRLLQPTESQAMLLRQLADDSARARLAIATACADQGVPTAIGQFDLMERRLAGLTEAMTALRPAFQHFYESLDDRQKARLEALGPARNGWRW